MLLVEESGGEKRVAESEHDIFGSGYRAGGIGSDLASQFHGSIQQLLVGNDLRDEAALQCFFTGDT